MMVFATLLMKSLIYVLLEPQHCLLPNQHNLPVHQLDQQTQPRLVQKILFVLQDPKIPQPLSRALKDVTNITSVLMESPTCYNANQVREKFEILILF
jgi:hypothetical protein